jgi:hypothetical protein
MKDPDFRVELRALEKEVKTRVYEDLQIYYDQLLVRLQAAGDLHNLKEMHRLLARFGSRKSKAATKCQPLPALRKTLQLRSQISRRFGCSNSVQSKLALSCIGKLYSNLIVRAWVLHSTSRTRSSFRRPGSSSAFYGSLGEARLQA